jgi:hypothetical protein
METEPDDKDFYLVRKNLNILSVLILLLAFTEAKLNSLSFLGIQLELDSSRFYAALWFIYVYFAWRFYTKARLSELFWGEFTKYFLEEERGLKTRYNYYKLKSVFAEKSSELKWASENDPNFRVISTFFTRQTSSLLKLTIKVRFYISFRARNRSPELEVSHDITVPRYFLWFKVAGYCLTRDKFGDYIFPFLPILLNLLFFLFRPSWQGSASSLLKL